MKKLAALLSLFALAPLPLSAIEVNNATYLLNNEVLDAAKQTGTAILFDGPACHEDSRLYGRYLYNAEKNWSIIEVCDKSHTDPEELLDTVRHEAWHLVQRCYEQPIYSITSLKANATREQINHVRNTYDVVDHHHELEAELVAQNGSDAWVAQKVLEYCS